jgi:hypothetical protein
MDHAEARSLVWMLAQMRAMVETQALERLERRLEEIAPSIEGRTHGLATPILALPWPSSGSRLPRFGTMTKGTHIAR